MRLSPELRTVSRHIRVLRDRVLIHPLTYQHPTLATVGVTINKGLVVAVGYGRRQRRKVEFRQKMADHGGRSLYFEDGDETGRILPMRVKVGDVVEYSFRNATPVRVRFDAKGRIHASSWADDGIELVFVWQNAIMTIDPEESASDALLFQQSAGYDRHGNFMSGSESWTRGV